MDGRSTKIANLPADTGADPRGRTGSALQLRLIATTDLHMELAARVSAGRAQGLQALVPVIAQARREVANSLCFDNGDLLQGNALGDHLSEPFTRQGRGNRHPHTPHPAIACLNLLGFDAATLGNHDFGYGRRFLQHALGGAAYPVVLANLRGPGLEQIPAWTVLHRDLVARDGRPVALAVGVIGVVPPQTAAWEASAWPGLQGEDVLDAVTRELPLIRAAGADLIVALSHGGPVTGPHQYDAENAASALAALPGIDAVIAGHLHLVEPPAGERQSPQQGHAPLVSAGAGGTHLGIIDLTLEKTGAEWRVTSSQAENRPAPVPEVAPAKGCDGEADQTASLQQLLAPHLRRAQIAARRRVARITAPMTSHFDRLGIAPGLRLIARAQRWHLRRALAGTAWEAWPILVAVAPFRAGGMGGPTNYLDLPAGWLRHGDLNALYAFPNHCAAIAVTSADLAGWLEQGTAGFMRITPGARDAPLIDRGRAPYAADLIDGLEWELDLAAPNPDPVRPGGAGRIRKLHHRGKPVSPDMRFVLATSSHRMAGTDAFGPLIAGRTVLPGGEARIRDLLLNYLRRCRKIVPDNRPFFTFSPVRDASAVFETAPSAAARLGDLPLMLEPLDHDPRGFLRLRLQLDPEGTG